MSECAGRKERAPSKKTAVHAEETRRCELGSFLHHQRVEVGVQDEEWELSDTQGSHVGQQRCILERPRVISAERITHPLHNRPQLLGPYRSIAHER